MLLNHKPKEALFKIIQPQRGNLDFCILWGDVRNRQVVSYCQRHLSPPWTHKHTVFSPSYCVSTYLYHFVVSESPFCPKFWKKKCCDFPGFPTTAHSEPSFSVIRLCLSINLTGSERAGVVPELAPWRVSETFSDQVVAGNTHTHTHTHTTHMTHDFSLTCCCHIIRLSSPLTSHMISCFHKSWYFIIIKVSDSSAQISSLPGFSHLLINFTKLLRQNFEKNVSSSCQPTQLILYDKTGQYTECCGIKDCSFLELITAKLLIYNK